MILYLLSWVIASVFTLIKGDLYLFSFFSVIDIDLITVLAALLVVFYGTVRAGLFVYGQGLLIDLLSGGVLGFQALIYLFVLAGIKLGSHLFDLQSERGQMIVIMLAVLLKGVITLSLLHVFSWRGDFSSSALLSVVTSAVCSGILGYFMAYGLFRFREDLYFYGEKDEG